MNRWMFRKRLLSAFPFIAPLLLPPAKGDGVSLKSASHPKGKKVRMRGISKDAIETVEIDLPIYAKAGEFVTCENGHPICEFLVDVVSGATQDLPRQLGNWHQEEPKVGQAPIPRCAVCGARFAIPVGIFHIGATWRDPHGIIAKHGMPKE